MNEPRKKILILIISFLMILVLANLFIIIPWIKEMRDISEAFLTKKESMFSLEKKIGNFEEIENDLEKIKLGEEYYNNSFIENENPIQFITFLEEISSDLETNLSSLDAPKKNESSLFNPFYFQLSVSGYYDDFARFLEKLESSNWLVEVYNINVSRDGEENDIRAELSFKVYEEK